MWRQLANDSPHMLLTCKLQPNQGKVNLLLPMDAKTIKTPDTLPWIPPGKPKDESFNKFVHKKGSIASRINAEVIHQENDLYSFKRNIFYVAGCRKEGFTGIHCTELIGDDSEQSVDLIRLRFLLLIPFRDPKGGVFFVCDRSFFPKVEKVQRS